jgi:ribonuclease I
MECDWIILLDSATKIGLGALIVVLRQNQKFEISKEEKSRLIRLQEKKAELYVDFLSRSQALVQSHLFKSCSCDTDEYKDYLASFNKLQILSSDEIRLIAYEVLSATNQFIVFNKNNPEQELLKKMRINFDEKLGLFQKVAQMEICKS